MLPVQLPGVLDTTSKESPLEASEKPAGDAGSDGQPVEVKPFSEHLLVASLEPGALPNASLPVVPVVAPLSPGAAAVELAVGSGRPAAGNIVPPPDTVADTILPSKFGLGVENTPSEKPQIPGERTDAQTQARVIKTVAEPGAPAAVAQGKAQTADALAGADEFVQAVTLAQSSVGGRSAEPQGPLASSERAVSTLTSSVASNAMMTTAAPSATSPTTTAPALVLTQGKFAEPFSNQITWMVKEGVKHASLRLNPPELGPIEVRVNLTQSDAVVSFVANHEAVREAIDAALPRLRQMLAVNGLNLADVDVSEGADDNKADTDATPEDDAGSPESLAQTSGSEVHGGSEAAGQTITTGLLDRYV